MFTRILTTTMITAVLALAPAAFGQQGDHSNHSEKQGSHAKMNAKAMGQAQTACPISGKPIDKKIYADYNGERVYFCCEDCKAAFKNDPAEVISKLKADGVKLEKVSMMQTKCPVMGGKIDKKLSAVHDGKKVYFCCPACKAKFEKDPAKYIEKMEAQGVKLEKVKKSE